MIYDIKYIFHIGYVLLEIESDFVRIKSYL